MKSLFFGKTFPTACVWLVSGFAVLHAALPEELILKGDALARVYKASEALDFYGQAEPLQPANADLLARMSRQYRHLMSDAPLKDEKLRLGLKALDYARRAVALAPENAQAQLAVAISYGKLLPVLDSKAQMAASLQIKIAAEHVLQLEPNNDLAWHIMGRRYRALAELNGVKRGVATLLYGPVPVATYSDAVRCFEKAILLNPTRPMHAIELGQTFELMGRHEDARRWILKGLALPNTEKDDPETKRHARETLGKYR